MNNTIQSVLDNLTTVFAATDKVLNSWTGEGCLQFPALLGMVAVEMNWDEKQVRENDPMVRYYIRHNPEWHVTRGAHGGIMRVADKNKKEAERLARALAKESARTAVDTKVAV